MIILQHARSNLASTDLLSVEAQYYQTGSLNSIVGPTVSNTRGSSATYVDSDGLIKSAGNNVLRIDHHPVTGQRLGALVEINRTNLTRYSGDLVNNTGWAGSLLSSVSGTGLDSNPSYQISEWDGTGVHSFANPGSNSSTAATSVTSGTVYTASIFLKKNSSVDWVQLTIGQTGFGTTLYANFNLSNGTVGNFAGTPTGLPPTIEQYSNDWYRCSITATATVTTTSTLNLIIAFTNNTDTTTRIPSYAGSSTNTVLASMAQFEASRLATSYIRSVSSSVSRAADVPTLSVSAFNQPEGVVVIEYTPKTISQVATIFVLSGGSLQIRIAKASSTYTVGTQWVGRTTSTGTIIASSVGSALSTSKIAYGYTTSGSILAVNGTIIGTSSTTLSTGSVAGIRLGVGVTAAESTDCIGHVRSFRYYKTRVSTEKIRALSEL
jgi:hypothetical protein